MMMLLFSKIKSRNQFTANAAKVANVVADKIYKMMLLFNKKGPEIIHRRRCHGTQCCDCRDCRDNQNLQDCVNFQY